MGLFMIVCRLNQFKRMITLNLSLSKKIVFVLVFLLLISSFSVLSFSKAASTRGAVSITFDDGFQSQFDYAFPLLQTRGIKATFYVITAFINTPTFMTTAELQTLQSNGHEIGSHGDHHYDLPSVTEWQMRQELQVSQKTLRSWGLSGNNFAYPDAARTAYTDSIVHEYYRSARSGHVGPFTIQLPTSLFVLPAQQGDYGNSNDLPNIKALVDDAYNSDGWVDIVFHNVVPLGGASQNTISSTSFASFLDYIQTKGMAIITVAQGLNYAPTPISPVSPLSSGNASTFGTTSVGGLNTTFFTGIPRATQYTPASSGTVSDIMLYLSTNGTGGHAQTAIYADSGNAPGALLAKSSSDTITSNGWHDFSGFNVSVTAGTPYWLACETNSSNLLWYYNNGGANYYQGNGSVGYGTFPNPYVRGYFGNFQTSIYAVYQ
jgi:peptidoglycan/xylan/chitin deacetylase (PgdA/CDA1 family)